MKMTGIESLYKDMRRKNIDRYKFCFNYAKVDFDVIFFIDESPFILMLGIVRTRFYFEVQVNPGYQIVPLFDEKVYKELVKLLEFDNIVNSPFKPIYFFEALNKVIPKYADLRNSPKPSEIAKYYRDIEEADKKYFWGWIDHEKNRKENECYKGNVTPDNLRKTRKLLGYEAYMRCKEKNISSRWTDDRSKEIDT